MHPRLILPDPTFKSSYVAALEEGFVVGISRPLRPAEIKTIADNFDKYLVSLNDQNGEVDCPDGITRKKVPYETLWLVEGNEFIGEFSFRHQLNDFLYTFGGHIGYGIRPGARRRGYGTRGLALTLERAREMNLEKVLVTCAPRNIASRKIIEASGGVLQDELTHSWSDEPTLRYWITL